MDDAPQRIPIQRDPAAAPFVVRGAAAPRSRLGDEPNPVCLEGYRVGRPHVYVETDVPPGMTLTAWRRAQRATGRRGLFARLLHL